jgi:hypothetical protein
MRGSTDHSHVAPHIARVVDHPERDNTIFPPETSFEAWNKKNTARGIFL